MRLRFVVLSITAVGLVGCTAIRDSLSSHANVVARTAGHELAVDQLARIIAQSKQLPVQRDAVEGIAIIWVDYTLFVDRFFAGDSLLDSATVMAAEWPAVQQDLADAFHDTLEAHRVFLDSAQVDSAYRAGDYRLIRHILFRTNTKMTAAQKAVQRQKAERLRAQLARGRVSWAKASEQTEEPGGAERHGDLGVIHRGEMVPPFDSAAYALAPGQLSPVTETTFGFHIISRPRLAEVFDEFRSGLKDRLMGEIDSAYLAGLPAKWNIKVESGVGPAVRQVLSDPLYARQSDKVLGSYRGGEFQVADLNRWIQAMPPQVRQRMSQGTDPQVEQIIKQFIQNEVLVLEARKAGARIVPAQEDSLRDDLNRQLALVRAVMGLTPDTVAMLRKMAPDQQRHALEQRVMQYLTDIAQNKRRFMPVPPFLADLLRQRNKWEVVPAGAERTLQQATQLRAAINQASPPSPGNAPNVRRPIQVPIPPPPDSVTHPQGARGH